MPAQFETTEPSETGESLEQSYEKDRDRLCALIRQKAPDPNEAEDLLHDAVVRVLQRQSGDPIRQWLAYFVRTTLNVVWARHAAVAREKLRYFAHMDPEKLTEILGQIHAESGAESQALWAEFQRELQKLPAQVQIAFYLFRFKGLKYDEIAQRLRVTRDQVKSYLSKATDHFDAHYSAAKDRK